MVEMKIHNQFEPRVAVPPGATLLETLDERGMSQADLCRRLGRPKRTINEIIKGKVAITPETALQLELVLGSPDANYWLNLEANYQETLARNEQEKSLENWSNWIEEIPIKELIERGFIDNVSEISERTKLALQFFGVASPEQWREYWGAHLGVSFRKNQKFTSKEGHLTAWLRAGELLSTVPKVEYDANNFKHNLREIRKLSRLAPDVYHDKAIELCALAGVKLVFLKQFSEGRVHGAAYWPTRHHPLILLSLRQAYDDELWFSFFHEAAHILLHSKKEIYVDDGTKRSSEEEEANQFAEKMLIPPILLKKLVAKFKPWKDDIYYDPDLIVNFAKGQGIAPSIVAGQLMHGYTMPPNQAQKLRTRLMWDEDGKIVVKKAAQR